MISIYIAIYLAIGATVSIGYKNIYNDGQGEEFRLSVHILILLAWLPLAIFGFILSKIGNNDD